MIHNLYEINFYVTISYKLQSFFLITSRWKSERVENSTITLHSVVLQRVVAIVARPRGAHVLIFARACFTRGTPGGLRGGNKSVGRSRANRDLKSAVANFRTQPVTPTRPFRFGRRRRRRRRHRHRRRHHRRLVSSVPTPGRSELLPCRPTGLPGLFAFAGRVGARFDLLSCMNKTVDTKPLCALTY